MVTRVRMDGGLAGGRGPASRVVLCLLCLLVATALGEARPVAAQETIECPQPGTDASPPVVAAATAAAPLPFPPGGGDLTIFAAASLTDAFEAIAADLEAANPGLDIAFNFAGSQALVTQLQEGAAADLFASAGEVQMRAAVAAGLIATEPVVFAANRLAIVVPGDNPAGIDDLADLAGDDVALVLAAPEVPAGQYAREMACRAAADPATYGEDYLARFAANIVSYEENVRTVLAKVQLGEADAGIVYRSDVTAAVADEVRLIEIPDVVNVVATYPIAPVAGGAADLAAAFIAYLLGPDGQATLEEHGFQPRP